MSLDSSLNTIEKYIPSDIILVLSDGTSKITMSAHKIILLSYSIYFEKLFMNFSDHDSKNISTCANCGTKPIRNIIINVPNVYTCYDILQSFYNRITNIREYPRLYHFLESFKCRDFFGLTIDQSLLLNLKVPPEGFDILINVIDFLEYTDDNIKIINKNFPCGDKLNRKLSIKKDSQTYDLSKFPYFINSK